MARHQRKLIQAISVSLGKALEQRALRRVHLLHLGRINHQCQSNPKRLPQLSHSILPDLDVARPLFAGKCEHFSAISP
jgi:hypothetical protein